MIDAVATVALLAVAWLLWSGHTEPMILGFGVASVLSVVAIQHRMGALDREAHPYHLSWRPLRYLPWLAKEVVISNLDVARVIVTPSLPIQPQLMRVPTSQKTDLGRVLYANSITLTPGTVSLDVRDDTILVHCITDASAAGLKSGDMDRKVTALEGEG